MNALEKFASENKKTFRLFWTNGWRHLSLDAWHHVVTTSMYSEAAKEMLYRACIKTALDKKCSFEQASQIWDMISSGDEENVYLALTLLQQFKPTKFLKKSKK